jgi:hypothetical protein
VRLHAYHSERVLARSRFLAELATTATLHHERLDGSGYHRGAVGAALTPGARLLAAADVYQAMTEPRPHRPALSPTAAADALTHEARIGRLDAEAAAAVLDAAGHPVRRVERPAGLTERDRRGQSGGRRAPRGGQSNGTGAAHRSLVSSARTVTWPRWSITTIVSVASSSKVTAWSTVRAARDASASMLTVSP